MSVVGNVITERREKISSMCDYIYYERQSYLDQGEPLYIYPKYDDYMLSLYTLTVNKPAEARQDLYTSNLS